MVHPMSQALTDAITGGGVPLSGADDVITILDDANVDKAVMMSLAFLTRFVPDDAGVSAENDFVAAEVAKFPDRLMGFCGINPLYPGALDEIDRCLALDGMVGIKLGPSFSGMDLTNADHVDALSAVFDKAREHDTPVQLHSQTPADPPMAPDALANLAGIMADHPNVRVSYSHCGGVINPGTSGQWLRLMRPNPDSAFLDLSICLKLFKDAPLSERERIVWLLRTWGLDRLLWGTDHVRFFRPTRPEFETPKESLETLSRYPFTKEEVDFILSGETASAWLNAVPSQGAVFDARAHPVSAVVLERLTGSSRPDSGADELIALLDEAKVEKAMFASFGFHARGAPDDAASSAENDFTAEEVAKYPDRLIGFCGINPLYPGALDEVDRCLGLDGMVGIKLQIPISGVDLTNADHVADLLAVFAKAEEHDAPVQLHSQTPSVPPYAASASANLAAIINAHPDVRVLHSHCGGFIDESTRQLWLGTMRPNVDTSFLDLSDCLLLFEDAPISKREQMVWMLRKWGIERVLWSSDNLVLRGPDSSLKPLAALETLTKFPFTQKELDIIRNNDGSPWLSGKAGQ